MNTIIILQFRYLCSGRLNGPKGCVYWYAVNLMPPCRHHPLPYWKEPRELFPWYNHAPHPCASPALSASSIGYQQRFFFGAFRYTCRCTAGSPLPFRARVILCQGKRGDQWTRSQCVILELKESQKIVTQTSGVIHGETWGPGQDSNLPEKMQLASGVFWLPVGVSQKEQVSAFLRTIQY